MTDIARDGKGRLQPGHKMGRPAGTSERDKIRALAQPHREAAIKALVDVLEAGDNPQAIVKAAVEILDRLAARPKQQAERVVVPGLAEAPDLKGKAEAVTRAVARGEISAEAGRQVLGMLADAARILQVDDFDRRLRALEGKPPRTIDGGELV